MLRMLPPISTEILSTRGSMDVDPIHELDSSDVDLVSS
jgi:hypothetical protein